MTACGDAAARNEDGAATLVMLALALIVVVLGLLVADVSVYLGGRARAQVAADAAALAAAPVTFRGFGSTGSAVDEAREFAAHNGGALLECRCAQDASWSPRSVTVRVGVRVDLVILGTATAEAWSSAEFVPTELAR